MWRRLLSAALCASFIVPSGGVSASLAVLPHPAPSVAEQALTAAGLWELQSLQPQKAGRKRREIRVVRTANGPAFGVWLVFSKSLATPATGSNPFDPLQRAMRQLNDAQDALARGKWREAQRLAFALINDYPDAKARLAAEPPATTQVEKAWERLAQGAMQLTVDVQLMDESFTALIDEWSDGPFLPATWAKRVAKALGLIDPMLRLAVVDHLLSVFENARLVWDVAITTQTADDALRARIKRCLNAVFVLAMEPREIVQRLDELWKFLTLQHHSVRRSLDDYLADYALEAVAHPELECLVYLFKVAAADMQAFWRRRAAQYPGAAGFDASMLNALVWEYHNALSEISILGILEERWPSSRNPPTVVLERLLNGHPGFDVSSVWRRNIERLINVLRAKQDRPPYVSRSKAWYSVLPNNSSLKFYTSTAFNVRIQKPGMPPDDWTVWPDGDRWRAQRTWGGLRKMTDASGSLFIGYEDDAEILVRVDGTCITLYTQLHQEGAKAALILPSPFRQHRLNDELLRANLRMLELLLKPGMNRLYVDGQGGVVDYTPDRRRNVELPEPLRQGQYMNVNVEATGLVDYPHDMHYWAERNGRWSAVAVPTEWLHPEVWGAFQKINKRIGGPSGALGIATRTGLWWSMAYARLRSWAWRLDSPGLHAKADEFAYVIAEAETLHLFMTRLPAVIGIFFDPSLEPVEGARYITYALIEIIIEEDHPSTFHDREHFARPRTPADTVELRAFLRLIAQPLKEFLASCYATLATPRTFHNETSLIESLTLRHSSLLRARFARRSINCNA